MLIGPSIVSCMTDRIGERGAEIPDGRNVRPQGERQRADAEEEAAVDHGAVRRPHGRRLPQVAPGQVPQRRPGAAISTLFLVDIVELVSNRSEPRLVDSYLSRDPH